MRALIAAKQQGKGIAAVSHPSRAPVVDLMEALKKSLEKQPVAAPKKPPVRSITSVASAKEAKKLKKA
jgi:non-homologous end joining protein Ku